MAPSRHVQQTCSQSSSSQQAAPQPQTRSHSPNGVCKRANSAHSSGSPRQPLSPPESERARQAKAQESRRVARLARIKQLERTLNAKFCADYNADIYAYMTAVESVTVASSEMMDLQPEIDWSMRPYLVDFLIEVALGFRLQPTTLHLAVNMIDRYTSRRVVFKKHYQLLGCSALWIAAKYEEPKDRVMSLSELRQMCCDAYKDDMFVQMESHILKTLEWQICAPTIDFFLQMMWYEEGKTDMPAPGHTAHAVSPPVKSSKRPYPLTLSSSPIAPAHSASPYPVDQVEYNLARYAADLALFHRDLVNFRPSTIASSCLALAAYIQRTAALPYDASSMLASDLARSTSSADTVQCTLALANHLVDTSCVLKKKYSHEAYCKVSDVLDAYLSPKPPPPSPTVLLRSGSTDGLAPLQTPIKGRFLPGVGGVPMAITPPRTPGFHVETPGSQQQQQPPQQQQQPLPTPPVDSSRSMTRAMAQHNTSQLTATIDTADRMDDDGAGDEEDFDEIMNVYAPKYATASNYEPREVVCDEDDEDEDEDEVEDEFEDSDHSHLYGIDALVGSADGHYDEEDGHCDNDDDDDDEMRSPRDSDIVMETFRGRRPVHIHTASVC